MYINSTYKTRTVVIYIVADLLYLFLSFSLNMHSIPIFILHVLFYLNNSHNYVFIPLLCYFIIYHKMLVKDIIYTYRETKSLFGSLLLMK